MHQALEVIDERRDRSSVTEFLEPAATCILHPQLRVPESARERHSHARHIPSRICPRHQARRRLRAADPRRIVSQGAEELLLNRALIRPCVSEPGESGWVKTSELKQVEGPAPLHSVTAMINLDMIGRGKEGGAVTVLGANSSAAFPPMLEAISKNIGLPIKLNKGLGGGGSDHANFIRRKIPVMFFFTGMHSQYNTPQDDLETVNAAFEARIIDMAWKSALKLAAAENRPAFAQGSAGSSSANPDRPMLGIIIDPDHEGAGVKITEVVEDSVAEKGKLEVGDVIIAFGETRVKELADLRKALEGRPQGKIKLRVIRGGSEKDAEVEFPTRQGGFRVSFGSVPDYGYAEKGVRFEDIRPSTPAAEAGVKPGDVLVLWAAKEVRDVQHWTELLGSHKPGDKVAIEVRREKKTVKMTVLLKAR